MAGVTFVGLFAWLLGSILGLYIDGRFPGRLPSAKMTFAIVDTPEGPHLTSVHLAKDVAEAQGVTEISVVTAEYRTTPLPLIPWKYAGQLRRIPRDTIALQRERENWHHIGEYKQLDFATSRIAWDFERGPAATTSIQRCRRLIGVGGRPALIMRPIGWFVLIYVPVSAFICTLLLRRWFRQFRREARQHF
ncbi:MAG: hypothetical protein AAF937_12160 [Planctomycetota bacterium]